MTDDPDGPGIGSDAPPGGGDPRTGSGASDPCLDPNEHHRETVVDEQIRDLMDAATRDRESFDSPAEVPDEERALELLREGFGQAVWVYVEGHTGGRNREFSRAELALLQRAMNDWLELYAQCYGVELDAAFTVREAAELLIETRNVRETAQLLTRIPER
jgi:hypothetical protein